MMDSEAHRILLELDALGVSVRAEGENIVLTPAGVVGSELRARIVANKADILAILGREFVAPPSRFAKEFSRLISGIDCPARRAELRALFEGRVILFGRVHQLPLDECERLALESLKRGNRLPA